jgi:DNA-binding NtrC family response regulator
MNAKILIADDEKDILDLLNEFMKKQGHDVSLADNVGRAIELLANGPYDIILTDKNMPGVDGDTEGGMTLLRYTRQHAPGTEVIMMTGFATVETAVEAMKLGAFDYIMKPISLVDLKQKIERVLEYRGFLNSEETLRTYRTLHQQMLAVLENRSDLPEAQLNKILRQLGARIDHLFGLQRQYETIIDNQTQSLENIEKIASSLLEAFPKDSPYGNALTQIINESKRRI